VTLPETVPVVGATGTGATALDAVDDALVAAGVGDYNLVAYSSVLPAGAAVERRDRLDPAHPVGAPVGAVVARGTAAEAPVAAALGWATAPEGGVFFEASGADPAAVEREVRTGVAGARERRDWDWRGETETLVAARDPPTEGVGAAVVVAVGGRLDPE
jgi:arginine decarboxylase